jgi:tetratricopeptide (TPR) repeat protein
VEAATLAGDYERALEASDLALEAQAEDPGNLSVTSLVRGAEKRAFLARQMGQPDESEDALETALRQLDKLLTIEGLNEEDRVELHLGKARLHETRAENRLRGEAQEIARLDLQDAARFYKRAGLTEEASRLKTLIQEL